MRDQAATKTIDDALEWLSKAVKLGFYSSNTGRLLKVAAEAVRALLAAEESRTLDDVLQNREQLYFRLINRSGSLSAASASSYISRAERLVRDYQRWIEDATGFQPRPTRARTSQKKGYPRQKSSSERRAHVSSESGETGHDDSAFFLHDWGKTDATTYREHLLALATGRAYIKLPERITPTDLKLIMAVVGTHCANEEPVVSPDAEGAEAGKH